jgi:hypothetical protein
MNGERRMNELHSNIMSLHLQFQPGFRWQKGAFEGRSLVLELVCHLLHRYKLNTVVLQKVLD